MTFKLRKVIPNLVTLFSLGCAFWAILLVLKGELLIAGVLILVATLIDGLDGELARRLQACSEFGTQLDSLADVVCFGVAPVVLMVRYLELEDAALPSLLVWTSGLVFLLSGTFRLARYNVQVAHRTSADTLGLPITGAGGLLVLLVFLNYQSGPLPLTMPPVWLPFIALGLAALMVSRISFLSKSSHRRLTIATFVVAALLSFWLTLPFVAVCILSLYLLHGILRATYRQFKRWQLEREAKEQSA